MSSVPTSADVLGNTKPELSKRKKISAAKRWSFTFNNYSDSDYCYMCAMCAKFCRYAIIAKEVGDSGTPHLQGYLEFKERRRPKSVFNEPKIHWELSKGSKADNITYCSKSIKPWVYPEPYRFVLRKPYQWQADLLSLIDEEPNDRTICWLHEPNGGCGKTSIQKHIFCNYKDVIVTCGRSTDMKQGLVEFYKINQRVPKIVLINIPRSVGSYVSYTGMEEIKDMFFYSPKYEGGMLCGPPPHVIVFSNREPDYHKLSEDRWMVAALEGKESRLEFAPFLAS